MTTERRAVLGTWLEAGMRRHGLTGRQCEIVRLVARGWTNGEIATVLFVSHNTVKNHLADVAARLGVHDRTQIVMLLLGLYDREEVA